MIGYTLVDINNLFILIDLFKKYATLKSIAEAKLSAFEKDIHSVGFYHNKAKNIILATKKIIEEYNGVVPNKMEELLKIPGVGRKSANVIMLEAFKTPQGIAVDTHAKRISNRLGFSKQTEPEKIEQDLLKIIPKEYYQDVNHLLVWHGRKTCDSRKPQCEKCPVKRYCEYYNSSLN